MPDRGSDMAPIGRVFYDGCPFYQFRAGNDMQGDIVAQGIELMLYGMGTVVLFLGLLVLATTGMSGFISRYFPEPELPPAPARERGAGKSAAAELDPGIVAVITAAIHQHRDKQN
jgi:oxaloacetate decarboxylase gamma subunit